MATPADQSGANTGERKPNPVLAVFGRALEASLNRLVDLDPSSLSLPPVPLQELDKTIGGGQDHVRAKGVQRGRKHARQMPLVPGLGVEATIEKVGMGEQIALSAQTRDLEPRLLQRSRKACGPMPNPLCQNKRSHPRNSYTGD